MSLLITPPPLMYAVTQHLKTTRQLARPVESDPTQMGEYRLLCLTPQVADAARIAHFLQAFDRGIYRYSVFVAEIANGSLDSLPKARNLH